MAGRHSDINNSDDTYHCYYNMRSLYLLCSQENLIILRSSYKRIKNNILSQIFFYLHVMRYIEMLELVINKHTLTKSDRETSNRLICHITTNGRF